MRLIRGVVLFFVAVMGVALAKPMAIDLVDVPVERLIANARNQIAKTPNDAHAHYVLARTCAIAYAQKKPVIGLDKNRGNQMPGNPELPPYSVKKASTAAQKQQAQTYLQTAIAEYRKSSTLNPRDTAALLGLGWCLLENGDKTQARPVLLKTYEVAIVKERDQKSWGPFDPCMACEALRYVKPLLDPVKDAALVKRMNAETSRLDLLPRAVTPILIPLDDVSFERCIDRTASVSFDLDASGAARPWQWITPHAGWLVYVGDGSHAPADGTRLIGARTFWIFWNNGYDALAGLDDNGDGWVRGDELRGLGVWRDTNRNGRVDDGEVRTLAEAGIRGLHCRWQTHPQGFPYSAGGVELTDGRVRDSYDWIARSR